MKPDGAEERRYRHHWPKPMFFCVSCDEQTDSDPCDRCGGGPVLQWKVVHASDLAALQERLEEVERALGACAKQAVADVDDLRAERDALAEALKLLYEHALVATPWNHDGMEKALDRARAALKTEGKG